MLGLLIYLVITVFAGLAISFILVTLRSTKKRGEGTPFPTIAVCLLLTVLGPYAFVEILTKMYGAEMEDGMKRAFQSSPLRGKIQYYRIVSKTSDKASALLIAEEKADWGGTERPVLSVKLEKAGGAWKPVSFKVIYSDRLNKDGLVVPPYR